MNYFIKRLTCFSAASTSGDLGTSGGGASSFFAGLPFAGAARSCTGSGS